MAFSVERDGNKTGGDRMFLGLSASSNPGVSVVTWGWRRMNQDTRTLIGTFACIVKIKILIISIWCGGSVFVLVLCGKVKWR